MARPQFTLRTLFLAISYFALAFGCFRIAFGMNWNPGLGLTYAGSACLGAGIGAFFGNQLAGVAIGIFVAVLFVFVAITISRLDLN